MDTTYCENCGILHDPDDGDCEGCKMQKSINEFKLMIKKTMQSVLMDTDDLSKLMSLGMFADDKTCDEMRQICREQILG